MVFCNKISSIQGGEKFWKLQIRCFSCFQEAHKTNQAQQQTIQNLTTEIQLLNEKVNYLTNKLFGRSKETLFEETNGQLNLLVMKKFL